MNLRALQAGDADAWNEAFNCLWPVALAATQSVLHRLLPNEVEDAAIEALEALVDKVRQLSSAEELKPLVAIIARNRAVSLLRKRFGKKRDEGKTESLEAVQEATGRDYPAPGANSPLSDLEQKELLEKLSKTLAELKPPKGAMLTDFFLNGLSYEEIARKYGVTKNNVGVHLKRGLEMLRRIWGRRGES